ncbi:MAG: SOS response-associated peptidase [Actinomycetota bacterium]|nr:SOS response-associated peptidase [Actinomycetota bacterium]
MCGRYTLATTNLGEVRARFPIGESVEIRTRYNVAPGDDVLAVTTSREGEPRGELLRWGLVPSWAATPDTGLKMINARVETVSERPAFRALLDRFRCLIIADGFYEWQRLPSGQKQAFHITRAGGELFAFAGLWSIWRGQEEQKLRSCTILTSDANAAVAPLHDRMPIILAPEDEARWLDQRIGHGELLAALRGIAPAQTELRAVGAAVNDARFDGPECLAPPLAREQQALF